MQQTQQFLCTSNSKLKGPETKKIKKQNKEKTKTQTKTQTQQPSCFSRLNKGTENMRQQNTKAQEKNKNYKMITIPWPPLPHPPTP